MSRWANWSRGTNPVKMFGDFLKEGPVDAPRTGNPTGNPTLSPAERARQLGLQSNGKGGYIDPNTGQIVARTVNNELVFYSAGPTGGAISDGSGGAALATPSTAWQDPVTGLMVTPPSQPETPGEIAAVPDPVPAQAPAGYNEFMQQKKLQDYQKDKEAREAQAAMPPAPPEMDPDAEMAQAPQPDPSQPLAMENFLPGDLAKKAGLVAQEGPSMAQRVQDVRSNAGIGGGKTLGQFQQQQPLPMPPAPEPKPQMSAAQRMAKADLSQVPEQNRLPDTPRKALAALRSGEIGKGDLIDDLTHRRDVLRKNPDAEVDSSIGGMGHEVLSKLMKHVDEPEPEAREMDDEPGTPDNFINDAGQPVGRRADHIWDTQGHLTELPGESASMQAIHILLNNPELQKHVEHLGVKPGSKEFKALPKDAQEAVTEYYSQIQEVLPSKFLESGWDVSSAKQAKNLFGELSEAYPDGIPKMNIMKPYEDTMENAMRLTNIPKEDWDDTYDSLYKMMTEKIGGEGQLRRVIDAGKRNVRDVYDPTDINLSVADKHDEILQGFQEQLDKIQASGEDGLSDNEIESVVRMLNEYKDSMLDSGAMRNISLKQIAGSAPGTHKRMGQNKELPDFDFDAENFGIDFGFGPRSVQAQRGGEFTDTLDFNNQGVNFPFMVGGNPMNVPIIPHPGGGPMSHNPFGTAGSTKSEPQMKGAGAKMGAIPITTWFDESLNTYSDGLLDRVGGLHQNLGVDEKGKLSGFSDEDIDYFEDQIKQATEHQGKFGGFNPSFNFNGEDMNFRDYMGKMRGLDDMIHSGKMGDDDFGDDEGLNDDQRNDGLAKNISREARDRIRKEYGNLPLSQVRQKMRTKLRSLRYLRLFQELEKAGPDAMNKFFEERIYNPANKINALGSPHFKDS